MGQESVTTSVSTTRDTLDPKYLEAMDRLLEYKTPTAPDGSFTVEEAADQWGVEYNTASKKLLGMYKDGLLDRIPTGHNQMYYWFKE